MARKTNFSLYLIVVLLVAWALLTFRIGWEWFGHQDANGAWISVGVRNYQTHGFFAIGGITDLNTAPLGTPFPYTHHPPLAVWLVTLPVLLVGYDETILRFVMAACTLIGAAALYALARRLKGRTFGLWSAAFYLLTPMTAYFGRMPDHEAPALMFILLFAVVLVDWLRHPTRARWWALVVLTFLTAWTAWAGLIMLGALGVMALFYTRRRAAILMLGVVALGAVIAVLGYYLVYFPNSLSDLINTFIWRTSSSSLELGTAEFTWGDYVVRIAVRLLTLYTPSLLVLVVLGALMLRRQRALTRAIPLALLAGALAYLLIFRNASFIHDYYLIYTAPGLALLAGGAVAFLPRRSRWLRPLVAGLTLLMLPTSLYYLNFLHRSSDPTVGLAFAQVIREQTTPEALIMSNLPLSGFALEFYAERAVQWAVAPAAALEKAEQSSAAVYYLQCQSDDQLSEDAPRISVVEIIPQCDLIRLR